jgi:Fe-S-cluster containining protein
MRDGPALRALKLVVLAVGRLELSVRRLFARRHGRPRYRLSGSCNGCGKCCEEPTLHVGFWTFHLPRLKAAVLWWQKTINGWELVRTDPRLRLFVFRCTHYVPETKRCDSYDSRPLACRDYPTNQLHEAVPELFPECSYVVVDRKAAQLKQALVDAGLDGEKLAEVSKKLHLDE